MIIRMTTIRLRTFQSGKPSGEETETVAFNLTCLWLTRTPKDAEIFNPPNTGSNFAASFRRCSKMLLRLSRFALVQCVEILCGRLTQIYTPYPLVWKMHLFAPLEHQKWGCVLYMGMKLLWFQYNLISENQGKIQGVPFSWVRLIHGRIRYVIMSMSVRFRSVLLSQRWADVFDVQKVDICPETWQRTFNWIQYLTCSND